MTPQRYLRRPARSTPAQIELSRAIRSIRSASRHFSQAYLHSRGSSESERLLSFARSLDLLVAPLAKIERGMR